MKEKVLYRATNATGPVHVLDRRRWFLGQLAPFIAFPQTHSSGLDRVSFHTGCCPNLHHNSCNKCWDFTCTSLWEMRLNAQKVPSFKLWLGSSFSSQTAVGNKKINLQRSTVVFALVMCMIRPLTQAHRTILRPIRMAEKMNSIYKLPRNKTSCLHEPWTAQQFRRPLPKILQMMFYSFSTTKKQLYKLHMYLYSLLANKCLPWYILRVNSRRSPFLALISQPTQFP